MTLSGLISSKTSESPSNLTPKYRPEFLGLGKLLDLTYKEPQKKIMPTCPAPVAVTAPRLIVELPPAGAHVRHARHHLRAIDARVVGEALAHAANTAHAIARARAHNLSAELAAKTNRAPTLAIDTLAIAVAVGHLAFALGQLAVGAVVIARADAFAVLEAAVVAAKDGTRALRAVEAREARVAVAFAAQAVAFAAAVARTLGVVALVVLGAELKLQRTLVVVEDGYVPDALLQVVDEGCVHERRF